MWGRPIARAWALAALLAAGTGCSTVAGDPTVAGSSAASAGSSATSAADTGYDLGEGLVWTGPAGVEVTRFERLTGGDCPVSQARVTVLDRPVQLTLIGRGCPAPTEGPLNGNHGRYLTAPDFAIDPSAPAAVPAGALVTFGQPYTECTNSCSHLVDRVGLITLTAPDDAGLPVLMLLSTGKEALDAAGIAEVAAHIEAG